MKEYNEDSVCPKCGCEAITTKFESAYWPQKFGTGQMRRRCTRCGYSWEEAPLNAEAQHG